MTTIALLILALAGASARAAEPPAAGVTTTGAPCVCASYPEELARLEHVFATRGTGARVPLTGEAHARFATHVHRAYDLAACLVACDAVGERARNPARRILAACAYKSRDLPLPDDELRRRLARGVRAMERCLAVEPADPECATWHASLRGRLAQFSWRPFQVTVPRSLLHEFRAARGTHAPGRDLRHGAATRGEASVLLQAPRLVGGDAAAAHALMERAAEAPHFRCAVSNRVLLAETRTRTGDVAGGLAELRAAAADGLPDCALHLYENAATVEEAARCVARIEAEPALAATWPDDCE